MSDEPRLNGEPDSECDIRAEKQVDYIYNDGSYAHRGVWHVTDNLEVTVHPARVREDKYPHASVTYRNEDPEYETATGRAICGQKDRISTGGRDAYYSDYKKPAVDGVKTIRGRAVRALYQRGGNPPMPLCSRCARKAGVDY